MGRPVSFFGPRVGLTARRCATCCVDDPDCTVFSPRERLLLQLCDELHTNANVGDELWAALAQGSPEQLVELVILAGHYHTVAFATNALRLPLEPLAARFPGANAAASPQGDS